MRVATHDGSFHADEVFALAALTLLDEPIEIVRTRDREVMAGCDLRVDVGFDYDPAAGNFDHHQREFSETRANGIGYASFGLIWREYGERVCGGDAELAAQLDQSLVQGIDANDTGPAGVHHADRGRAAADGERRGRRAQPALGRGPDRGPGARPLRPGGGAGRADHRARGGLGGVGAARGAAGAPGHRGRGGSAAGGAGRQRALEVRRGARGPGGAVRDLPQAPGLRPGDGAARAGLVRQPPGPARALGRAGRAGPGGADRRRGRGVLPRQALPRGRALARGHRRAGAAGAGAVS